MISVAKAQVVKDKTIKLRSSPASRTIGKIMFCLENVKESN